MNRRSFFSGLAKAAIAVTMAGRMTFQPELKEVASDKLRLIMDEMRLQVMEAWHQRMKDAYTQLLTNHIVHGVCGFNAETGKTLSADEATQLMKSNENPSSIHRPL